MVNNQTSNVKDDSLVSDSGSGEPGALRRSVRDTTKNKSASSPSPVSVRKSQRLETPKKKDESVSESPPLRRSERENKFQSKLNSKSPEKGSASKGGSSKIAKIGGGGQNSPGKKKGLNSVGGKEKGSVEVGSKRKTRLDARCYRSLFKPLKKIKGSGSPEKRPGSNCDSGGSGSENDVKKPRNNSDDEEVKEHVNENIDGDEGVSGSDVNIESNKKVSNEVSSDSNVSRCDPKGSPVAQSEGIHTFKGNFVSSASSGCYRNLFIDPCDICLRKKRLDYSSLEEGLCCCLQNSINNVDMSSLVEDRGESGTVVTSQSAEEQDQDVQLRDSSADVNPGTCVLCKREGELVHCGGRGCRRSYHPPCLLTPKVDELLPVWYCSQCTKKRLTLGEHSVSDGIESVWGFREVQISTSEGEEKQKQYFVKYKGLAHIHNHWVPEMLLIHEGSEVLANISQRKEAQWKPEWAVPHRLLQKRSVIIDDLPAKHGDENIGIVSNGQCEWLVKWVGLGYDQASWEWEESLIHKTPDMQRLIREFETRQDRARMTHLPGADEVQEKRKGPQVKLGRLSGGGLSGSDSCYLNSVNKLREHHNRGHNAVLLDEQDSILKVIYLISSLVTSINQPFLIITSSGSLLLWEAVFMRLDSSVNVVVYSGTINARKMIRMLEFNGESGSMMLQVLLSSAEVISEDLEELKGIEWEGVVVDRRSSCIWAHSISIKNLSTNWRVLLLHDQLKDDVAEFVNILSFLEAGGSSDKSHEPTVHSSGEMDILKDRLSSFVVCSRFLEYWVPVQISNVQLEQYCSLILSSSAALRSLSKSDPVGSLREILISTRKCCDHPYVVDPLLQSSIGTGYLQEDLVELGIKASGKLHLLDKVLLELKNKKLKVLIIFQSIGGSGRDTMGNILEDYLSFRFGPECYEHVDGGGISSKKQAALNRFNKDSMRSFLLLETRACLPSIKLSTIHAAIIFNSDWNPLNDVKALQRITIDSKLEPIKVFRLYCTCTVEEKVLILAKNDVILDTHLQGNSTSTNHMLLMWGSSYLFSKLDEFHGKDVLDWRKNVLPEDSIFKEVCEEILSFIQHNKSVDSGNFILAARQNGGSYHKNTTLLGEQKIQLEEAVPPHVFWTNLLDGKQPQWKYLSGPSQRNRKRVSYLDVDSSISSGVQPSDASKKRKKLDGTKPGSCPRQSGEGFKKSNAAENSEKGRGQTSLIMASNFSSVPDVTTNEQKELLQLLKPAVLKLCEILLLKDNGKILAERFLDYIVKNHRVSREPETILEAFQISVCWTVAAALNQKIDHAKSLSIAREKMNFSCREDEADFMYSKLKLLKKMFFLRSDASKVTKASNSPSSTNGLTKGLLENSIEPEERLAHPDIFDSQVLKPMETSNNVDDTLRHIKKVKKRCDEMMERLKNKHNEELEGLKKTWEEEKDVLEKKFSVESAVIRSIHSNSSVGVDKLKILDSNYVEKRKQLENQFSNELKKLETKQQAERIELQRKVAGWLEKVKSLVQDELLDELASENGPTSEHNDSCKDLDETACATRKLQQNLDGGTSMVPLVSEVAVNQAVNSSESDKLKEVESGNLNVESLPEQPPTTTREMEQTNIIHVPEVAALTSLETNQVREGNTRSTSPASIGLIPLCQELGDDSCQRLVDGADQPVQPIHESVQSYLSSDGAGRTPGTGQTRDPSNGRLSDERAEVLSGTQVTSDTANSLPEPALRVDNNLGQCQSHPSIREALSAHTGRSNPFQLPGFSVSPLPSFNKDPLENEWERISRELNEVGNSHEEMKRRLISERTKEIEEVVAQIHKKYDGKIKETDATFSKRRNELTVIQEKVMMHKFLAEAFRSKCNDTKASSGVPQVSLGSIDQFLQLSGPRPSALAGSFPSSPHTATCPVQPVPANVSTVTTRSPHIPLVPSQVRGHPQSFRPSSLPLSLTSSSMPFVSCNVLTQQPRGNATSSSTPVVRPSQLLQRPQNTFPRDHTHQGENMRSLPSLNLTLSSTDLVMQMRGQNEYIAADVLPPLPDNVRNSESWDISAFGTAGNVLRLPSLSVTAPNVQLPPSAFGMAGNVQLPPSSTSGAVEDVVCLSDDD